MGLNIEINRGQCHFLTTLVDQIITAWNKNRDFWLESSTVSTKIWIKILKQEVESVVIENLDFSNQNETSL